MPDPIVGDGEHKTNCSPGLVLGGAQDFPYLLAVNPAPAATHSFITLPPEGHKSQGPCRAASALCGHFPALSRAG